MANDSKKELVIVESPAKARTIKKYLGKGYVVKASNGHVRDLPKKEMGVDIDGGRFEPKYVTIRGKGKLLTELRKAAAAADRVLLASDFDREGEAISWHIYEAIKAKNPNIKRIVFNAITEQAIKESVANAQDIDMQKVNAQQARRILDRLVGYQLSPLLWKKVQRGLSAGRVQSVAVRLVCAREQAIRDFVPQESWSIEAVFETDGGKQFEASLYQIDGEKSALKVEADAAAVLSSLDGAVYNVAAITKKRVRRRPSPPFITSTLQQEASRKLRLSPRRTMMIAQGLYEGINLGEEGSVALISYMRTDSTRIAPEAQQAAAALIRDKYGSEYVPAKPPVYKSKHGAQDAHEAIRPVALDHPPERVAPYLDKDQLRLYTLIWNRFISSQMAPAKLDQTAIDINDNTGRFVFRATGSVVVFPGFMAVYIEGRDDAEEDEPKKSGTVGRDKILPPLENGQTVNAVKIEPNQHFTKPPARYTEAMLVRALEEKGIGRPSTYASIVNTIQSRNYVTRDKGRLVPTELGETVNGLLIESFPEILDEKFTAMLEEQLDEVEEGKCDWQKVLREFYDKFEARLKVAKEKMRDIRKEVVETDEVCEQCGKPMVIRRGRFGQFLACSGFPECRNSRNLDQNGEKIERKPPEKTDKKCPKCGAFMVIRTSARGKFYGCSKYPKCRGTAPMELGIKCPVEGCDGDIVERRSKSRRIFYGCSKYPDCEFSTWHKPVKLPCPKCGAPFTVIKKKRGEEPKLGCLVEGCDFEGPVPTENE
ncbi:MAG: type I DNA topoisomerase [Candidatus Hydrogenedentes bacterium]|nr:type I DNA topoisomerase [Candidatus Hydrogenedentota bacterium]